MSKRFYLTTAIDYVNGQPHLGHAFEKVVTDVIARAHRAMGDSVFFLTGLDEHGQKVQQAASKEGCEPQSYCDALARDWQAFAHRLQLTHDDFIRTTEPRHQSVVQSILTRLHALGHFYKSSYEGFYSAREETFLTEKDRLPDGSFPSQYGEVTKLSEDNWYFKLRDHQTWLIDYITAHPSFIYPDYRRNEVLGFLRNNSLEDLCISRPASRLSWGIPIPFDPGYVTYVWFDALVSYLSSPAAHGDPAIVQMLGLVPPPASSPALEVWPADAHVIGKDILKFHAVFWPIMLKAMGLPLPRQLIVHGWWQKDGEKISKSTGNIVEPIKIIDEWGVDAFRYYVVRELDLGPDGNWTDAGFAARYQAELANGLGNLVNRSLSMLKRYRNGVVPPSSTGALAPEAGQVLAETEKCFREFRLQSALESIWSLVARANQYVEQTAPFKLAKDPSQSAQLDTVLYNLAETCRVLAILLAPFIPETSEKILRQLGLNPVINEKLANAAWGGLPVGHTIGDPAALFPRKDLAPK